MINKELIVVIGKRGARLADPEVLTSKLEKMKIEYSVRKIQDCQKINVLDFPFAKAVGSEKFAFDWLVKGRGFNKFSRVEKPADKFVTIASNFSKKDCAEAFMSTMQRSANVKTERRLDVYSTSIIRRGNGK